MHPKTRKCSTEGFLPCQASYGVLPSTERVKVRFSTCTAVVTASPQKKLGNFLAFIMDLAMPTTVWLRRSTTPFCCGEYGAVKYR
jgi:hypothetical protein